MTDSTRRKQSNASTAALGFSVARRGVGFPLPKAHFRVFLGRVEVAVESVSPLHWSDSVHADLEAQQTVVLRRAVGNDRSLYNWRAAIAAGKDDVRDVTIVQLAEPDGKAVNIWLLEDADPVRWSGPDFHARSGEIAYEELEIRYKSIAWRTRI